MGSISLSIPVVNQPNSTEDPKIATDLTTIQTVINGNLDTTNLSASAAIVQSQLAIGSWVGLTVTASPATPGTGDRAPSVRVYGDMAFLRGYITLPSGFTSGTSFATLPVGAVSANTNGVPANGSMLTAGGVLTSFPIFIEGTVGGGNNGIVLAEATVASGSTIYLDGIFYMLT